MTKVLILGSGPNVVKSRDWPRDTFDHIVAINNAWAVRPDWDFLIHPDDFPADRCPVDVLPSQTIITSATYVSAQNAYGGFVYAGGTMAFTAGYWALHALRPSVMAFIGCDMVYSNAGNTHFYGTGTADPLRTDVSLRSLEAKASRLQLLAARDGCACLNLSTDDSRLTFPRATLADISTALPAPKPITTQTALAREAYLNYVVPSGKYWKEEERFDIHEIDKLDALWREAA